MIVAALGPDPQYKVRAEREAEAYAKYYKRVECYLINDAWAFTARLRKGETQIVHLHADTGVVPEKELLGACWRSGTTLLVWADYGPPPKPSPTEDWPWLLYLPGIETPPGFVSRLARGMPIDMAWGQVLGDPRRLKFGFGGLIVSSF